MNQITLIPQNLTQVSYQVDDAEYPYMDIFVMNTDDFNKLTSDELTGVFQTHYNAWKEFVKTGNNPPGDNMREDDIRALINSKV